MTLTHRWEPPRIASARPPLLVAFHGRGADEADLLEHVRTVSPAAAIAAPRGPVVLESGYTWFENRGLGRPESASLRASAGIVSGWLDGLDPSRYDPARIYLYGFSAGMLMASALMLDRPERFAGAVLLSGTLPWDVEIAPSPGRFAGTPVFYARGDIDEVIPLDLVDRSVAYLENESGARLTVRRYPAAHEITSAEDRDIAAWFARLS